MAARYFSTRHLLLSCLAGGFLLAVLPWPLPSHKAAQACTFTLNPMSRSFAAGGGSSGIAVAASGAACAWTAVSNAAWITITAGANGAGNGVVSFSVSANLGPSRAGTLTVAGQTFSVNQDSGQDAGAAGLQFYPLTSPVRLLDTRPGASPNACSQPNQPIAEGTSRTQPARAFCGIPANAQAITGNVTTVNSGGGYLTLYPSDASQPPSPAPTTPPARSSTTSSPSGWAMPTAHSRFSPSIPRMSWLT